MFMAPVNKHSDPTYEMLVLGALATGPVYRRSQKQQKVGSPLINWSISGLDKQTLSMHVPAVGSGEAKDCPTATECGPWFPPIRGLCWHLKGARR